MKKRQDGITIYPDKALRNKLEKKAEKQKSRLKREKNFIKCFGEIKVKSKYKHFNPEEHKINVKIAKVRVSSHSKHNINYHIVFIPKYRKAILTGEKLIEILSTIIKGQCEDLQCDLLALEIMP